MTKPTPRTMPVRIPIDLYEACRQEAARLEAQTGLRVSAAAVATKHLRQSLQGKAP
jgi:hypothetical protein